MHHFTTVTERHWPRTDCRSPALRSLLLLPSFPARARPVRSRGQEETLRHRCTSRLSLVRGLKSGICSCRFIKWPLNKYNVIIMIIAIALAQRFKFSRKVLTPRCLLCPSRHFGHLLCPAGGAHTSLVPGFTRLPQYTTLPKQWASQTEHTQEGGGSRLPCGWARPVPQHLPVHGELLRQQAPVIAPRVGGVQAVAYLLADGQGDLEGIGPQLGGERAAGGRAEGIQGASRCLEGQRARVRGAEGSP